MDNNNNDDDDNNNHFIYIAGIYKALYHLTAL